ncbi:hypothetical protein KIN20_022292 [Parelaphostrongylus tenuis]|uniref:Uncharacterized protein n=1 Tax=Parelaphostrongylus tenuis TaxID=148309 RepID=A0AAD5N7V7_PARTN|nr:hypothetical protein KIN20_022292 [Parelaphostrongylus tenuis]
MYTYKYNFRILTSAPQLPSQPHMTKIFEGSLLLPSFCFFHKSLPNFFKFQMGHTKGFHVCQMEWPQRQRGTYPVVGVATKAAALQTTGHTSLIGTNTESY